MGDLVGHNHSRAGGRHKYAQRTAERTANFAAPAWLSSGAHWTSTLSSIEVFRRKVHAGKRSRPRVTAIAARCRKRSERPAAIPRSTVTIHSAAREVKYLLQSPHRRNRWPRHDSRRTTRKPKIHGAPCR